MSEEDIDKAFCVHLGQRIRSAREHCKLSEVELGDHLNPPRTAEEIRQIEAGLIDVFAFELNQFSIVLDVPFAYFGNNENLAWLDYQLFFNAFVDFSPDQRRKVIELIFAIVGDVPVLHSES